ncbi:NmrA-like family protein [Colletotrichum tofieldiae]|nr:NmrA-like family protein [Colletotrichum tofieldiae]GKT80371.1 NmrA-like family protein [Colletotrichum tofieldiae]GKT94720.1 nmrA-like family protein [Colletotrichum tofieldiae]
MVVVAVAGGTGGLGKTVIEQLLVSGKHEILVFSRKAPAEQTNDGIKFILVDYSNVASLVETLDSNNVETVISTIGLHTEETEKAQLSLIQAAKQSKCTKRFMPSEFGLINTPEY